jgi:hypothetical protein
MRTLSLSEAKMKLSALVEALQTNDEENSTSLLQ